MMGGVADVLSRVVRASLGAMSTTQEVDTFVSFLHGAFIEARLRHGASTSSGETEMDRGVMEPAYSTG
jgi:hypothetical protein